MSGLRILLLVNSPMADGYGINLINIQIHIQAYLHCGHYSSIHFPIIIFHGFKPHDIFIIEFILSCSDSIIALTKSLYYFSSTGSVLDFVERPDFIANATYNSGYFLTYKLFSY